MLEKIVKEIIEEFRKPFQADGGDMRVVSCADNLIKAQIVLGPTTCRECIMSPEDVKEVIKSSIEAQYCKPIKIVIEVVEEK